MIGEIKDAQYVASLPCNADSKLCMDLPTRLIFSNYVQNKTFWKGRIIPGKVLDESYGAVAGSYVVYPASEQLVLEGRLCRSSLVDDEGKCTFDRSQIKAYSEVVVNGKSQDAPELEREVADEIENSSSECPVCAFMKAGPCKAQFLEWDKCVGSVNLDDEKEVSGGVDVPCFPETVKMMECMRKYEYYDIMTTNMAEKYANALAGESPKPSK